MADAYLKVKDNGASGLELVREDVESAKNTLKLDIFKVPYAPLNMSTDPNGKIFLDSGYVNPTTGASSAIGSSSTIYRKYWRTQAGSNANSFLSIGDKALLVTLDLDWVQWTCFSYSGVTNETATHSNSRSAYIPGTDAIFIPKNSTDARFSIGFRGYGDGDANRPAFTDEQVNAIKSAIKFYVLTDDSLSIIGSPADAKATGNAIKALNVPSLLEIPCPDVNGWTLVDGGIYVASGQNFTAGNYCRLTTSGGRLYKLVDQHSIMRLGLDDYQWTAWTYSGNTWSDGSRCLTGGAYRSGILPIEFEYQPGDVYFAISFRRKDLANITNDDKTAILNAFKIQRYSYGRTDRVLFLGDSITRGSVGGESRNARFPIPTRIADDLGIICENFGIGNLGWCAGWVQGNNKTNAIGYLKRVGDSDYYNYQDTYAGYKFIGSGGWDDFNTIAFALGVNDLNYTIGSLDDLDDTLSYSDVMAWKTSAEDSDGSNRTIVKAMYQAIRWIRESEDNHGENEPYVPGGKYKNIIIIDPMTGSRSTFRINLCELYKAFCEKYGVKYISAKDVPIDPLHISDYLPDNVHPNDSTYAMLGRYFASKF